MILHGYWRSGAAWRVRIALALKGVAVQYRAHDLRVGEQRDAAYLALNPQGLVPALEAEGGVIVQSGAILEYLDERFPAPPLLPASPFDRAVVRGMAGVIACDTHPLANLRVQQSLRRDFGLDKDAVDRWLDRWIGDGLTALERLVERHGRGFAFGNAPSLVECILLPQLYSARRFGIDVASFPALLAAESAAAALSGIAAAHPDAQPGADPA